MTHTATESPTRLQDFIDLAKSGDTVEVQVRTTKKIFDREYLLIAEYRRLGCEEADQSVSKIYAQGLRNETSGDVKVNKHVANQRLEMDYDRLKKAGVLFEERFF